jgi:hypothetical protein
MANHSHPYPLGTARKWDTYNNIKTMKIFIEINILTITKLEYKIIDFDLTN